MRFFVIAFFVLFGCTSPSTSTTPITTTQSFTFSQSTRPHFTRFIATPTLTPLGLEVLPGVNPPLNHPVRFALKERVRELMRSHPDTVINTNMLAEVEAGRLVDGFQNPVGLDANFTVYRREDIQGGEPIFNQYGHVLMFSFEPSLIAAATRPDIIEMVWLEIRHEYEHRLQYQAAKTDLKRSYFFTPDAGIVQDEAYCRARWTAEFEAYQAECADATAWGVTNWNYGLCEHMDHFGDFMIQFYGPATPACRDTWLKMR